MMEKIRSAFASLMGKVEKLGGFRLYAAMLFVAMFLAYDAQVWRMGFYYDDWEGIFLYKQGFSFIQVWEYFLIDRPFSALVHTLYNPFFGASSVGWHLFGLLLNWAAILFLVKMLLSIWPGHIMPVGWIGFLLGVYPGISRQFVVKTSMPHFTSMLLFTLSLLLMVQAFKNPRRRPLLVFLSVVLGGLQVLLIEYFSGLELIRLFILFYLVRLEEPSFWRSVWRALLNYAPYILVILLFGFYKFALLPAIQIDGEVAKHSLGILDQFRIDPGGAFVKYANNILQDVFYAIVYVWTAPVIPQDIEINSRSTVLSWLLGGLVGLLAAVVMEAWVRKEGASSPREARYPLLIGAIALISILVGGLPAWSIGRQALVGLWSGRFLLGQFFGAVAVIVLLVLWFTRAEPRFKQHLALALFLVSAFSLQFRTGNRYVLNWNVQRDFFWQLKWRAPSLEPKSFIVSPSSPLAYNVDYQLAFTINILYGARPMQTDMDYWWFNGTEELPAYIYSEEDSEQEVITRFRTITFSSDMLRAVPVLYRPSRGCLLVAAPIYAGAPILGLDEQRMFLTSHPEVIRQEETPTPADVFGVEPPRTWCYYFQKADLARQYAQWDEVLALWQSAQANGYAPVYGPEYLPFIEAYARQDDWETAAALTEQSFAATEEMSAILCSNWERLMSDVQPAPPAGVWEDLSLKLTCTE